MLEIITLLTHMILLSDWEPPGVSSWTLPKGAPPVCERGGAPAPAGGGSDSVYVCWFMCVSGKFPVRFQFYRTRCQSRKLRHVMFCNICIKNPNLRKILIFPRFIGAFGRKNPPQPLERTRRALTLYVGCMLVCGAVTVWHCVWFCKPNPT